MGNAKKAIGSSETNVRKETPVVWGRENRMDARKDQGRMGNRWVADKGGPSGGIMIMIQDWVG